MTKTALKVNLLRVATYTRGGNTVFLLHGFVQNLTGYVNSPAGAQEETTLVIRASDCQEDVCNILAFAQAGQALELDYMDGNDMGNAVRLYRQARVVA
jgi:hypothetical protein